MSFAFHLEAAVEAPVEFQEIVEVPARELGREPLLSLSPLTADGVLSRIEGGGYELSGHLVYRGTLECSRCLAEYPFEQESVFRLILIPRPPAGSAEERELASADLDIVLYNQPVIPLRPLLEEQVQIAMPMKPLCREDCLGLCPTCGNDLNQGRCGCVIEVVDPRWEALRALKKDF